MAHIAYKFRIYPTPEQEGRLRQWQGALRVLWNVALEQWNLGLARSKGERIYPTAYGQSRELTALRAEMDWMADVPRRAQAAVLGDLEAAWKRCFSRTAGAPRFKGRSKPPLGVYEAAIVARLVTHEAKPALKFPKLGLVPVVQHREVSGEAVSATITRDVDQWFVSLVYKQEATATAPAQPPAGPAVGIDRGVTNLIADSLGRLVPRPAFLDRDAAKVDRLRRQISKKKRGSANKRKAILKAGRAQRKLRRRQEHVLQELAKHYASSHAVVVVEALNIANMTASAKGTAEEPGSKVAQKAGLNRKILSGGWGKFVALLKQKATIYGSTVVEVTPAYSSQTCAACGHVDAANRPSQSRFRCLACGHEDHADINAAKVLVQRYEDSRQIAGSEVCGGDGVSRPTKQKGRVARRATAQNKGKPGDKKAA